MNNQEVHVIIDENSVDENEHESNIRMGAKKIKCPKLHPIFAACVVLTIFLFKHFCWENVQNFFGLTDANATNTP